MRKKKNKASKRAHFQSLPLIHPNAAGIDVGVKEHVVAVPCDRDPQPVRTFQAWRQDLTPRHPQALSTRGAASLVRVSRRRSQPIRVP